MILQFCSASDLAVLCFSFLFVCWVVLLCLASLLLPSAPVSISRVIAVIRALLLRLQRRTRPSSTSRAAMQNSKKCTLETSPSSSTQGQQRGLALPLPPPPQLPHPPPVFLHTNSPVVTSIPLASLP